MLRDVIGAFLDTATEREFDAPLMNLLASRGFWDIHFLHGSFEFGKDFIAKGRKLNYADTGEGASEEWITHQFALQSKAGNLGAREWREVRLQLDSARLEGIAHPSFDGDLPRTGVLVATGQLNGSAPAAAESYRAEERRRGRPDIEVWDRGKLLTWLADDPDVGLAGTESGAILALLAAIDNRSVKLQDIEKYTRHWLAPAPGGINAALSKQSELRNQELRSLIESAVIVNRLRCSGRIDLASYTALALLRAAWSHSIFARTSDEIEEPRLRAVAIRLFVDSTSQLLNQFQTISDSSTDLFNATVPNGISVATYPATCLRVVELLGLLGIVGLTEAHEFSDLLPNSETVIRTVEKLVSIQNGTRHPLSDSFAASLIAPTLLLASSNRDDLVSRYLTEVAVWVADHYDVSLDGIGLSPPNMKPIDDLTYVLGGRYTSDPGKRRDSYLATVLVDLAAILEEGALYSEFINEFEAVGAVPSRTVADEITARWCFDGSGVQFVPRVLYRDPLPASGLASAEHEYVSLLPVSASWDSLALSSLTRNRHCVASLRAVKQQLGRAD